MRRIDVGPVAEFHPGRPKLVPFGSREIGVYLVDGVPRAILNFCPHEGIKICSGRVESTFASERPGDLRVEKPGQILACPWHGWQFDLVSGRSVHDPECRLKTFEAVVDEGNVYVLVPER